MRTLAIALIAILGTACSTPYQPAGLFGGFTETRLGDDIFTIRFKGNAYTSQEMTQDYTIMRAAELTLESGHSFFIVGSEKNTTTSSRSSRTSFVRGVGFHTTHDVRVYPGQKVTIKCFTQKPDDDFAFDARTVRREMRRKYASARRDEEGGLATRITPTSRPRPAVPPQEKDITPLEAAISGAKRAVLPSSRVTVVYDEEKQLVRVSFSTPTSYQRRGYARWRANQARVLQAFKRAGVPVRQVSVTTNLAGSRAQQFMVTRADAVERYTEPNEEGAWLSQTATYRRAPGEKWKRVGNPPAARRP